MPDFDTNSPDNSNPQQTAQGPQDAQPPASAVPSDVNVPAPPTPVPTQPNPVDAHHTLIGKALSGVRHAIEGKVVTGYQPDENGVLQEITGPRKPGGIFRDILLGAMIGGAAGSETPNRESALGGFAMGGATAIQNQDARYANQAAQLKKQAQEKQQGEQRNQQRIMQEAQVAHQTINLLDFDSHSNRYNPSQIDTHNASNDVMRKQLLANGGRVPTILVNGQNLNDGKANNGYALMQQFNKDPQSVMQAPEGFHRLPVTSIDTSGLQFSNGQWLDADGKPADLEKYTTHTLVDIPDQAFGQTVQLSGAQINSLLGYQQIPANQSKKLFSTSIASIMGLNTKSIKSLNDARRDLYAAPKNDAEYQSMQARVNDIQQRMADDPSSVTDEEKHFLQAKGGVLTAYQKARTDAQNADAASKRQNEVADINAKAGPQASAEALKEKTVGPLKTAEEVSKERQLSPIRVNEAKQKAAIEDNAVGGANGPVGSDYFNSLPPAEQSQLQAYRDGRLELSAGMMRNKAGQKIVKQLTTAFPDFDASKAPAYYAMRKDFTSGKTADGITALNTAIYHLERAHDNATTLATVPGVRFLAQAVGNHNAAGLNSDKEAVSMELGKAYKNGIVTEGEAKAWKSLLDAPTPSGVKANISELSELLTGRLQALQERWNNGRPSESVAPVPIVNAATRRIYKKLTGSELDAGSTENEQPTNNSTPTQPANSLKGKAAKYGIAPLGQ